MNVSKTLNDRKHLTRLSDGDTFAQELKYHISCLTDYTIERGHTSEQPVDWNRNIHSKKMPTHRYSQS